MSDNPKADNKPQGADSGDDAGDQSRGTGEQELDFEHGYAEQDNILSEGETLEDVAGVSEEDIRDDLLGAKDGDTDTEVNQGGAEGKKARQ